MVLKKLRCVFTIFLLVELVMPVSSVAQTSGVREEWVRVYEMRTIPSYDVATDLVIDDENNVYVTGYSTNYPDGLDFCTIKYDANGNRIWSQYFDGEAHGDDMAHRIALDSLGNVYVGGSSAGIESGFDMVVVKYTASGVQLWATRYDGSLQDDHLQDMILDNFNNIVVTGDGSGDFVTIQYASDGSQVWEARFDGPNHMLDEPRAVFVDGSGNVYVTGQSRVSHTDTDYITIKYNSEGLQLWEARYPLPDDDSIDSPLDIAVDDSGNVYVTGLSESGNNRDYATIKYGMNGEEIWTVFYDGLGSWSSSDFAYAITLDSQDNVYVTGRSEGVEGYQDYDIATVKYNSDGKEIWIVRYGEGVVSDNGAVDIIADHLNNIYVLGYTENDDGDGEKDYVIIKYNQNGEQLWSAKYDGTGHSHDNSSAFAVGREEEVIVCGWSKGIHTDYDYATVKYDSEGNQAWDARFNGENQVDGKPYDLVIDTRGNIIVTGESNDEFITIKYDPTGNIDWTAHYSGNESERGGAIAIVRDYFDNVYVTGELSGDCVTIKYDPDGEQRWISRFDGGINQDGYKDDRPVAMAVDGDANVYITGRTPGIEGVEDFFTIKYNSDGNEKWISRYNGGDKPDYPSDICVDKEGNVYVTGYSQITYTTVKYNANGEEEWVKNCSGVDHGWASSIALDGWGNVYVTGHGVVEEYNESLITVKYCPDGIEQWIAQYIEQRKSYYYGSKIVVDEYGNTYIAGSIVHWDNVSSDYITIKYDINGIEQWSSCYDGPGSTSDIASGLTIDREGNVYVTGQDRNIGTFDDIATVKYNPDGEEKWVMRYAGPGNARDTGKAVGVDASGNVYVVGSTQSRYGSSWSLLKVIKYSQTGVDSLIIPEINGYQLSQNHPNPCNNQTLIWYHLPKSSGVTIKIFSVRGRQVIVDDLGERPAGKHPYYIRTNELPSGVYYYRIQTGDFVETRKMVVLH